MELWGSSQYSSKVSKADLELETSLIIIFLRQTPLLFT